MIESPSTSGAVGDERIRRVLITCPPMLRRIEVYRADFEQRQFRLHCPEVVQTLDQSLLLELVPDCDGWIVGDDQATRTVLAAGREGRLRAVVKWGVGVDNIDRAAISELGIAFSNTPGVFGGEVADVAVGYVIALARQTFLIDRCVREGGWPKPCGISLSGKSAAIVGFGDVGRSIARRLQAMDVHVIAYDPAFSPRSGDEVCVAPWPARLEEADILVLSCALTVANRHMINREILRSVKRGLRVVNVARGPLIDEGALADAIGDGTVAGAALDVFEQEPLAADSPLRRYEQCIFGSHNASNTEEAVDRASRLAMQTLFTVLCP